MTIVTSINIYKKHVHWLSPGQTDSQVDASLAKPELAHGLAMGGQTDSHVGSQVHTSRKKSYISRIYSWLAINLCRLTLGGQTVNNLRGLAYEFELDQSQRKWVAKRNASRKLASTCKSVKTIRTFVYRSENSSWPYQRTLDYIEFLLYAQSGSFLYLPLPNHLWQQALHTKNKA